MKVSKWITRILVIAGLLVVGGSAGFAIYFSHGLPASPEAIAALHSTDAVTITDTRDQIMFMPKTTPRAALIFYPGARIAPAAYAARLEPVAERGFAVFIIKFPLNLAVFGMNRAGDVIAAHPNIKKWAVGGHSLGGAFAGSFIEGRNDIKGLILYGSYPAGNLAHRTDLIAVSIYGTNDGLATVEKVNNAKTHNAAPDQVCGYSRGNPFVLRGLWAAARRRDTSDIQEARRHADRGGDNCGDG